MVDDFYLSENQKAFLEAFNKAMQPKGLSHYGEEDVAFEYVLRHFIEGDYLANNVPRVLGNMKALLEVKREEMVGIPNCGKKTIDYILRLQELVKKNYKMRRQLEAAITAEQKQREYRLTYGDIIKEYEDRCRWNKRVQRELKRIGNVYRAKGTKI